MTEKKKNKKRLIKQSVLDKIRADLGFEVSDEDFYKIVDNVIGDIKENIKKEFNSHEFKKEVID